MFPAPSRQRASRLPERNAWIAVEPAQHREIREGGDVLHLPFLAQGEEVDEQLRLARGPDRGHAFAASEPSSTRLVEKPERYPVGDQAGRCA